MPILPILRMVQTLGIVASPLSNRFLPVLVPIVPINHLLNVVVIGNTGVIGTRKRVYTRNSLNRLGTCMGTRRMLCVKN